MMEQNQTRVTSDSKGIKESLNRERLAEVLRASSEILPNNKRAVRESHLAIIVEAAALILSGDVRAVLDLMGVELKTFDVVESGPREDGYGGWVQEEPHIESSFIEPARCHLAIGSYIVVRVGGSDQ